MSVHVSGYATVYYMRRRIYGRVLVGVDRNLTPVTNPKV